MPCLLSADRRYLAALEKTGIRGILMSSQPKRQKCAISVKNVPSLSEPLNKRCPSSVFSIVSMASLTIK